MRTIDREVVFDFLNSDVNFFPTLAIKQHWTISHFSYMGRPRPDHGLMLLVGGRIDFKTEHQTISAFPGDVVFLPKGCYYDAVFRTDLGAVDNYLINFDADKDIQSRNTPVRLFENAALLLENDFKRQVEDDMRFDHSSLHRKGRLYLFLDLFLHFQKAKRSEQHNVLHKAQMLLQGEDELTVGEIARICCTSESSLRRLFKEVLGISPVNYRINAKINQATYLLDSTDLSVGEIAEKLNFFDEAYFCKVFRAHLGVTPKRYVQNKKL